jgi:hypothetical protein
MMASGAAKGKTPPDRQIQTQFFSQPILRHERLTEEISGGRRLHPTARHFNDRLPVFRFFTSSPGPHQRGELSLRSFVETLQFLAQ